MSIQIEAISVTAEAMRAIVLQNKPTELVYGVRVPLSTNKAIPPLFLIIRWIFEKAAFQAQLLSISDGKIVSIVVNQSFYDYVVKYVKEELAIDQLTGIMSESMAINHEHIQERFSPTPIRFDLSEFTIKL